MSNGAEWVPVLDQSGKPLYLAIADAIAQDVAAGRLNAHDRLPPQRWLAERLDLNFSTISRAYAEAQRRGLIASHVGQGTFVCPPAARPGLTAKPAPATGDMTMNLPPEPGSPALLAQMQNGLTLLGNGGDLQGLLRYQGFGGTAPDRAAGAHWLAARLPELRGEHVLVCPGAQSALLAILLSLTQAGDTVCCEALTYPGFRTLAAHLGLVLAGLPMDDQGVLADAFAAQCRKAPPKALYLNPTLHNPTTRTLSLARRQQLIAIARQYAVPILEDDAYGALPNDPLPPLAALAPEITFYVGSLAKCLGAGLRIAYLVTPDTAQYGKCVAALRAASVMASPITAALATQWITDGTATAILDFIRSETTARQDMVAAILPPSAYVTHPQAFHVWLQLPSHWNRMEFLLHLRTLGVGLVASDGFTVTGPAPEAARLCIGGPMDRPQLQQALTVLADTLRQSPAMMSAVI